MTPARVMIVAVMAAFSITPVFAQNAPAIRVEAAVDDARMPDHDAGHGHGN